MLLTILSFQRNYNRRARPWYEDVLEALIQIPWPYVLLALVILFFIFKRTIKEYHPHWTTLIPNFKYLFKDFHTGLKKELHSQDIKGTSTSFVRLKEGGIAFSCRLCLWVQWKNYQYNMCCAPF